MSDSGGFGERDLSQLDMGEASQTLREKEELVEGGSNGGQASTQKEAAEQQIDPDTLNTAREYLVRYQAAGIGSDEQKKVREEVIENEKIVGLFWKWAPFLREKGFSPLIDNILPRTDPELAPPEKNTPIINAAETGKVGLSESSGAKA